MSSRLPAFIAGLVILAASVAGAQDLRELERRADSAIARAVRASAAREALRKATEPSKATYIDTIAIADEKIIVLSNPEIRAEARAAAELADATLRTQLGAAMSMLRGDTFTVRLDTARRNRGMAIVGQVTPNGGSVYRGTPADANSIAATITQQSVNALVERSNTPFSQWRGGSILLPPDGRANTDWSAIRFALVSSATMIARRCYGGDLDACAIALELRAVDDPVMVWYDSLGRFEQVRRSLDRATRVDRRATERCQLGSDKDCAAVLLGAPQLVRPPLPASARLALLQQAVELGGEGAVDRLLRNTGTPSDALAAAARVPIDTLLSRWQTNARVQSIKSGDLSVSIALVSLGWVAVLAFFAFRSSRWR